MFCSQCGSQVNDAAKFCAKCGARVGGAPVQPQPQVVVQPQPQPQVVVQPQPQVVQPQPQVVVQPQPQVAVQSQPQAVIQPQSQVIVQPQIQTDAQGTANVAAPKKKKKSPVAGIIIGVIAAADVFAALIIGVVKSGVLKSPKKAFAENAVGVFENINKELPNIGMSPAESILHLTIDDTKDSHTTTATTTFYSDNEEAAAFESFGLEQSYSYDADNGNAAYEFSVTSGGSVAGTGAI